MADEHAGGQPPLTSTAGRDLSDLGEKIFLDRYALKDATKATLAAGDLVVVCTDTADDRPEAEPPPADLCPECGEATLVHAEGCQTCSNCGHSEC